MNTEPGYLEVPTHVDLPAMERELLRTWTGNDVFHRTLRKTENSPRWTFYEGPPTANGTPGTHHVEARVFKDVFPRYRTMRGFHVPRRAGWDCHGLPVELAVERELGFSGKQDIEAYGIAEFNERCRESVRRHVDRFVTMTDRMGYWVDVDDAYWTMSPDYVQSVWWSLKKIFDAGLLVEDHRVAPYCPRCGTGLSEHEVAQGYENVADPSALVCFPVTAGSLAEEFPDLALLVWTTTPWTLISNTAVAVRPDAEYVIARTPDGRTLVVAAALAETALGAGHRILASGIPGSRLVGTRYRRPFDLVEIPDAHVVVAADFVTIDDGTGLVHLAPAFGADDLAACRAAGLPVVNPVRADGTFEAGLPLVGGVFFKDADPVVIDDLRRRGLLLRSERYEHAYPHCWRCHTPLIYYAQPSWYIRTTAVADRLLAANEDTTWYPGNIKWGRFGDWLRNNVDWALSRNRYWGTPLPIWRCPDGHLTCVGSLTELGQLAGRDLNGIDPHRPFVDDVTLDCPTCSRTARRVPEVIDCWYDSGAMPFAQLGYPHRNADEFGPQYPADFICEAIDQTRGWFYTLMAIGVLVFDESAYRNVLCLGHILDADGRKMSKHLGNVLEPVPLMDEHGADAVRWFMLAAGSPWQGRRVSHQAIEEAARTTLRTLWSTASFLSLYGRIAGFHPGASGIPDPADRPDMDRWALARVHQLVVDVESALDRFDTQTAGRLLADFVDDLSNWYVRRTRRRFWDGDPAALATLHECVRTTLQLMAPFTPFITDRLWSDLISPTEEAAPDSVHLSDWPTVNESLLDPDLMEQMALVRRLVELGRAARAGSRTRTRQPLGRGLVSAAGWDALPEDLIRELGEEINVLAFDSLGAESADLVSVSIKANFRSLGRRLGNRTPGVAKAIGLIDPRDLRDRLARDLVATVESDGGPVEITPDDVIITETPREGWSVATGQGETLALDLTVTDRLRELGLAREAVRFIQQARKDAGLDVTDRIRLQWSAREPMTAATRAHLNTISRETLAVEFEELPGDAPDQATAEPGAHRSESEELGISVIIRRA